MDKETIARIESNSAYIKLRKKRNLLGGLLSLIAMFVYYGWISLIAFNKEFLAKTIGQGVTTIAIPIGIGVIVFMVLLTAIYVLAANKTYDGLVDDIKKEIGQ